jgi:hypothetical protein
MPDLKNKIFKARDVRDVSFLGTTQFLPHFFPPQKADIPETLPCSSKRNPIEFGLPTIISQIGETDEYRESEFSRLKPRSKKLLQ